MTIFFCFGNWDGFSVMTNPRFLRFCFGFVSIWLLRVDIEKVFSKVLDDGKWEDKIVEALTN